MTVEVDALICGGGVTGLWLRALLKAAGRSVVLLETGTLGGVQTIASQGIIHSGAKYAADARRRGSLLEILPAMTVAWDSHLKGDNTPKLKGTLLTARETWYWTPDGKLPACLNRWCDDRPSSVDRTRTPPQILQQVAGESLCNQRERCLSPSSLIAALAGDDRNDLLRVEPGDVEWDVPAAAQVRSVRIAHPGGGRDLALRPRRVFLAAGAGNGPLRAALGLTDEPCVQHRPLQMGLVRGALPTLCGHWFDDRGPRLTISTQQDSAGDPVWQLGGRLAEETRDLPASEFLALACRQVETALPGIDLTGTEWTAYRAVRAEAGGSDEALPTDVCLRREGTVTTLFPNKMTLLPYLMIDIRRALEAGGEQDRVELDLPDWPRPEIARPPWDMAREWTAVDALGKD